MARTLLLLTAVAALCGCAIEVSPSETPDVVDTAGCSPYCVQNQVYACNDTGQYVLAQTCQSPQVCLNGACQAPQSDVEDTSGDADAGDAGAETDLGPEDTEVVEDVEDADATPDVEDADATPDVEDADASPDVEDADAGPDVEDTDTTGPTGESCADPIPLEAGSFPVTVTGSTAGMTADVAAASECPGAGTDFLGQASSDAVYRFTAPAAGIYTATVTPQTPGFDAIVYAFTDCANIAGTCVGFRDVFFFTDVLKMPLEAGATVFLVVDGYHNTTNVSGDYSLTVGGPCVPKCGNSGNCGLDSCGVAKACTLCSGNDVCGLDESCQPAPSAAGNSCYSAWSISGAGEAVADMSEATDIVGFAAAVCGGSSVTGAVEHVYTYAPEVSGTHTVRVEASFPVRAYVLSTCADLATCLGSTDTATHQGEAELQVGTTAIIVVEAVESPTGPPLGPYKLVVEAP